MPLELPRRCPHGCRKIDHALGRLQWSPHLTGLAAVRHLRRGRLALYRRGSRGVIRRVIHSKTRVVPGRPASHDRVAIHKLTLATRCRHVRLWRAGSKSNAATRLSSSRMKNSPVANGSPLGRCSIGRMRTESLTTAGIWRMSHPSEESSKARSSSACRRFSCRVAYRSARVARAWSSEAWRSARRLWRVRHKSIAQPRAAMPTPPPTTIVTHCGALNASPAM